MRMPAGKPAKAGRSLTRSSKNLLGRLVIAEGRALPNETSAEIGAAPSMRSKPSKMPASSTIATETFHLFFSASAMQAAIIFFTSAAVRHGLLRMASPFGESQVGGGGGREFPFAASHIRPRRGSLQCFPLTDYSLST